MRTTHFFSAFLLSTMLFAMPFHGQGADTSNFEKLIAANQKFGAGLLAELHKSRPESNVVVSPLPLTLTFGAMQGHLGYESAHKEIDSTFGFRFDMDLPTNARMIITAFDESTSNRRKGLRQSSGTRIESRVLYRSREGSGKRVEYLDRDFISDASRNFGIEFLDLGGAKPDEKTLRSSRVGVGVLPNTEVGADLWISSGLHFRSAWYGNTFSLGQPVEGNFNKADGQTVRTEMLLSEMSDFPHAINESFEAVALPCYEGSFILVSPAKGKDIHELVAELAKNPGVVDEALKKELGVVLMPSFHIVFEANLRTEIEALGVRTVFKDLRPLVSVPNSHITEISQHIDIKVDHEGIVADSETVTGVVVGGLMGGREPFKMIVDRPFLFFVREKNTGALLFTGAVMNPKEKPATK